MVDFMTRVFGEYAPIDGNPDWGYICMVAIFCVFIYSAFRFIGGLFRK